MKGTSHRLEATVTGALLVLMLTAAASVAAPEAGVELDRIIATIDGEPVLLSDVLMEMDLGLLVAPGESEAVADHVEPFLNRLLIAREVEEVGGFSLTPAQEESGYQGYLVRFPNRREFETKIELWGITEQDVQVRLNRALLASLYTESRVRFFISVLPADIEDAYENDPDRWGDRDLYEAWNDIRNALVTEAFTRELDRWVETLRTRYRLTLLRKRIDPVAGSGSDGRGHLP